VLGERAEDRVGEEGLVLVRLLAGDEEPEVAGEIHLADDLADEVLAAHGDASASEVQMAV
jgi:sorbitol-specific phosphotransferase system component IIA